MCAHLYAHIFEKPGTYTHTATTHTITVKMSGLYIFNILIKKKKKMLHCALKVVLNNIRLIEISEYNRVTDLLTPDIIPGVSRGCLIYV